MSAIMELGREWCEAENLYPKISSDSEAGDEAVGRLVDFQSRIEHALADCTPTTPKELLLYAEILLDHSASPDGNTLEERLEKRLIAGLRQMAT